MGAQGSPASECLWGSWLPIRQQHTRVGVCRGCDFQHALTKWRRVRGRASHRSIHCVCRVAQLSCCACRAVLRCAVQAKEIMYHKANLNRIMAEYTGQPVEKVREGLAAAPAPPAAPAASTTQLRPPLGCLCPSPSPCPCCTLSCHRLRIARTQGRPVLEPPQPLKGKRPLVMQAQEEG